MLTDIRKRLSWRPIQEIRLELEAILKISGRFTRDTDRISRSIMRNVVFDNSNIARN